MVLTRRSGIGAKLMEMRHSQALALTQSAFQLDNANESHFILEVAEKLAFSVIAIKGGPFSVLCQRTEIKDETTLTENLKTHFDSEVGVKNFIAQFKEKSNDSISAKIIVRTGRRCVYHSFMLLKGDWVDLTHETAL